MSIVTRISPYVFFLVLAHAFLVPVSAPLAQEVIAVIQQLKGDVSVTRNNERTSVAKGFELIVADTVHTASGAAVGLQFTDGALVALGGDTEYALDSYTYDRAADRGSFDSSIKRGSISVRSGRIAKKGRDRMRVRTPATILGVRGTRFMVRVDPDE